MPNPIETFPLPTHRAELIAFLETRRSNLAKVMTGPGPDPKTRDKILEIGARVCFNLCLAAQAHGFGAQWLTEWYAYDAAVNAALGLSEGERVSGFIYIGTPTAQSSPRARPPLETVTLHWGTSS